MQSTILITPLSNIVNNAIVDSDKILKETYDFYMDIHTFYNVKNDRQRRGALIEVSIYEDLIVRDGEQYKILQMLLK